MKPYKNKKKNYPRATTSTAWEQPGEWYNEIVGERGHYYHEHLIIPGALRLLKLHAGASVLDMGCGQGVMARALPKGVDYWGIDAAPALIKHAHSYDNNNRHHFVVADATKPLPLAKKDFSHATAILSIQNIEHPEHVFANVHKHLVPNGMFVIVLNHPCFRIPRQSGWYTNPDNKLQCRWVSRYMAPMKIPLQTHPGKSKREIIWSFHQPLSAYVQMFHQHGFVIETIEEWTSDKVSIGKAARQENLSRAEFPLFLALVAKNVAPAKR